MIDDIKKITFLISVCLLMTMTPFMVYGSCGLQIVTSDPNFGDLEVGEESEEFRIGVRNSGSETGVLSFTSTAWKAVDNTSIMSRNQTHYSITQSEEFDDMFPVNANNEDIKNIKALKTSDVYLKVLVEWLPVIENAEGFFGVVQQDLTFDLQC